MGRTIMSDKELNKAMVVGLVIEKKITQKEAAKRLSLSTRQIKRLVKKYALKALPQLPMVLEANPNLLNTVLILKIKLSH